MEVVGKMVERLPVTALSTVSVRRAQTPLSDKLSVGLESSHQGVHTASAPRIM